MQDGAPDDPAQHVATALVGGRDAVGRDRAHPARVVAEHAERAHGIAAVGVATARKALQGLDHVARLVGLEEAADAIAAYLPHRPRPKSLEGLRKNLRLGTDGRYRWHYDPAFVSGMGQRRSPESETRLTDSALRIDVPTR